MVSRGRILPSISPLSVFRAMDYMPSRPLESATSRSRGCGQAISACASARRGCGRPVVEIDGWAVKGLTLRPRVCLM